MGTHHWKSALGLGGALLALLPTAANAGSDGRKNTALVLGAAAAYELLHGKTTEGIALGAGAAYAAKRYEDARRQESDQRNGRYYYDNRDHDGRYNGDYERYSDSDNDYGRSYYRGNGSYHGNRDNDYNGDRRDDTNGDHCDRQYDSGSYRNGNGQRRGWSGRSLPPGQWRNTDRDRD